MKRKVITRDNAILRLTQYATVVYWINVSNEMLEKQIFHIWGEYVHIKRWYEFWLKTV